MKILLIDQEGIALDFALRCARAGHEVRWFRYTEKRNLTLRDGEGFDEIKIVDNWRDHIGWVKGGLIWTSGNFRFLSELDRLRTDFGAKVFSPTIASARLEIERSAGQELMQACGCNVPPYQTFNSLQDALAFARKSDRAWVHKPMGSEGDKSLTYVSRDPADLVGWLQRQIKRGKKTAGKVMLQEKIDGVEAEIGVSGWMGSDGFLPNKWNISFEHKPLMDGDIGPATGEQGCYSADTEVLTDDGWKLWPDVRREDALATLVAGQLRFEVPSALVAYEAQGKMIHWQNRSLDILVTPNHNMWVAGQSSARRRQPDFVFKPAAECTEAQYLLARTAAWQGESPQTFVVPGNHWHTGMGPRSTEDVSVPFRDWCRFLGIYFAEGSASRSLVDIAQSHPAKSLRVAELLAPLPFAVIQHQNGFRLNNSALARVVKPFGRSYEKRVPDYIKKAEPDDIAAFLDAFALGDGHAQANGSRAFYTSNEGLAGDLQELMLRCGRLGIVARHKDRTTLGRIDGRTIYPRRPAFIVWERARKTTGWLDVRDRSEVNYAGKVYCATVSSHLLFVRRNGRPVWCGNTIMQYVQEDKLADEMLKPLEPTLRALGHTGDFSVGAMLDKTGKPWFLEFTARAGWPAFYIQTAEHRGDPVRWMMDALDGHDTLKVSEDVAIGVVLAQPRYPYANSPPELVEGNPIEGVDEAGSNIHLAQAMRGKGPMMKDGRVAEGQTYETSGEYVAVVTALGKSVNHARKRVYRTIDKIHFPDMMYRTDIGCKVIKALPRLHDAGFALDMEAE